MNIAIISGSARPARQSHQVALEIQRRLNQLNITHWLWDVKESNLPPLEYTFDSHPNPDETLKALKAKLDDTTAFILVSPEHNGSYPGALKNSMDHFYTEYAQKAFGTVTVSNGIFGGISALKNLQHYALKLGGIVCPDFLLTPQVQKLFADQVLVDEAYAKRMEVFLEKFLGLAGRLG